jgi:hypothetical protein
MDNSLPNSNTSLERLYTDIDIQAGRSDDGGGKDQVSTDINDYTNEDLLELFDLNEDLSTLEEDTVQQVLGQYISHTSDNNYKLFFMEAQNRLLQLIRDQNDLTNNDNQGLDFSDVDITRYYTIGELMQIFGISTPLTLNDIETKIDLFRNGVPQMETFLEKSKQRLVAEHTSQQTNENFSVPIVEGLVNPHRKELIHTLVVLDSEFRDRIEVCDGTVVSNNYTCSLSQTIYNVVSFSLVNVTIPTSWDVIHNQNANHYFYIDILKNGQRISSVKIEVPNGNYTPVQLVDIVNDQLSTGGHNVSLSFSLVAASNRIKIVRSDTNNTVSCNIIFYNSNDNRFDSSRPRNTLGYILGFMSTRTDYLSVYELDASGNGGTMGTDGNVIVGNARVNTSGTKYIYVVLDDLNQNRVTNAVVGMSDNGQMVQLPSFYHCDLDLDDPRFLKNGEPSGLSMAKAENILSILATKRNTNKPSTHSMTHQDIFAVIPVNNQSPVSEGASGNGSGNPNTLRVDIDLSVFQREYFGPVTLRRFKCKLLDDRGQPLQLNGQNWSLTLNCKCLYRNTGSYQYTPIKGTGVNQYGLNPIQEDD